MAFWDRLFRRKSAGVGPDSPAFLELLSHWWGGWDSESGEPVTSRSALTCSAVYACVGLLAESVAQLPIKVYRAGRDGKTKTPARDHPLWALLRKPNDWQTSFEFREMAMQHLCLRGNFYAYMVRDNKGTVRELLPLMPDKVQTEQQSDWSIIHRITFKDGHQEVVSDSDVFHIRYRTIDGIVGLSPISYHRETVGLTLAALKHGARFFKNGGKPGGVLEHPKTLSDSALEHLKEAWEATYGGANVGKTAVLEEGMTYHPVTISNADAQYIELREFQVEDIARIYRVPLHEIQSTKKTTSWGSGIEQMNIGFVTRSLLPWVRRWEETIEKDLVTDPWIFPKLVVEGMLRGDTKSRYEGYQIAITNGFMCPNEVREKEDMNPRDGGDDYLTPLNMQTTGGEDDADTDKVQGEPGEEED